MNKSLLKIRELLKGSMKKIFSLLAMSVLLSGCVESMALIGPATTGAGSGKIAQSAMSSGLSFAVKKQTGKTVDKFGNEVEETHMTDSHAKKDNGKKVHFQKKQDQKDDFNKLFKPSGKFIYGNDVLSKIKEVL